MKGLKQDLTRIVSRHSLDVDKIDDLKSSVNNHAYLENPYRYKFKKMNSPKVEIKVKQPKLKKSVKINLPQIKTNFVNKNMIDFDKKFKQKTNRYK